MNELKNLPTDSAQWNLYLSEAYKCMEKVAPTVAFGRYKISLIMTNLNTIRLAFKKNKCGFISTRDSKILFDFFVTCSGFIAFCSQYTKQNFLPYLLQNNISKQYDELSLLWSAWSTQSTALLISAFTFSTSLTYAHYLDIKVIHDLIAPKISKFKVSIADALNEKLDDIKLILKSPPTGKEQSRTGIIEHSDFEIIKPIGKGAYATVNLATFKKTGKEIAVKELKQIKFGERNVLSLKRELDALLRLDHPNLLNFVGVTVTPAFCIATTYIGNGSLFDNLHSKEKKPLTPVDKLKIATCMARGLEYLAAMHFVHRDFKSQNVLLDDDMNAIICDFGISRITGPRMTTELGTVQWTAPEVLAPSTTPYDTSADTYSYGIVLWELLTGGIPYSEFLRPVQIAALVLEKKIRPTIPNDTPKSMARLIRQCWKQDPNKRPKMQKVRESLENGLAKFTEDTDMKAFEKWVSRTKQQHVQIMKKANDLAAKEESSILTKVHTLNPLDPTALTILQQLYKHDYPLSSQLFQDMLRLISQLYSIPVQEAAFDIFKAMLVRNDLLDVLNLDQIIKGLLNLLDPQPQYAISSFKLIASHIDDIESIIDTLLQSNQSHAIIEIIQSLITPNIERINIELPLKIFKQLKPQFSVTFFNYMVNAFGARKEFIPISCQSLTFLSLFMKQLSKMCDDNPDEVKKMLNVEEVKLEGRSALQQHLHLISISLLSQTCDINEKMGIIIYKFLVSNCIKYKCFDSVLPLLHIVARVSTLRPMLSNNEVWNFITDGLETENAFSQTLFLIERIPMCQDEEVRRNVWENLIMKYKETKDMEIAHTIASLVKRYNDFNFKKLLKLTQKGLENKDKKYVLSSLKIMRSFNEDLFNKIINDKFWKITIEKINENDEEICKSIGKLVLKMINLMQKFDVNIEFCNTILKYLYKSETSFNAASNFIVFLISLCKDKRFLVYLQKRYFMQYLEQLPFRYENDNGVDSIIEYCVNSLVKYC